ncbi:hypothetical protein BJF83_06115 [Nocardiopsis sp. CNR-923]|uniref:hypothetical protein n=1 Tax=Nocardiopsis sp. CNR-923 TaxID=1904965 RepID=UPI00095A4007|nr:hypothetical protein [Nocardiopsis sp. CNR-923]OLT25026.1 hypothetical protein BJF83_06115 [Nocardiopsis sp. CNR-923]
MAVAQGARRGSADVVPRRGTAVSDDLGAMRADARAGGRTGAARTRRRGRRVGEATTEEDLVAENSLILDVIRKRPNPDEVRVLSAVLRTTIRARQRQWARIAGPAPCPGEPAGSSRAAPGRPWP